MGYKEIPSMTRERWISNLLEAISDIANKNLQERRWLAPDANAWEHPDELINVLFDDCNFDLFLSENAKNFSEEQCKTAFALKEHLQEFCDITPVHLNASEVLADPRWEEIRQRAAAFIADFKDKWPISLPDSK